MCVTKLVHHQGKILKYNMKMIMKKSNSFEMLTLSLLFYAARTGMSAYCRLSHMHTLSTNGWYSVTWKILVPSKPHVVAKKRLLLPVENLLEQQQFINEESDLNYQAFQQKGDWH